MVYSSASRHGFNNTDLVEILDVARRRNADDGITGMLIYHQGAFLQALEGPESRVLACLQRIQGDRRHHDIEMLSRDPTESRAFTDWSLGFAHPAALPACLTTSVRALRDIWDRLHEVMTMEITVEKQRLARQMRVFLYRFRDLRDAMPGPASDRP